MHRIRRQIRTVWPADSTKVVDTDLSEKGGIFQRFEHGAIEAILTVDNPLNSIIEFDLKPMVFQYFNKYGLFHLDIVSGEIDIVKLNQLFLYT